MFKSEYLKIIIRIKVIIIYSEFFNKKRYLESIKLKKKKKPFENIVTMGNIFFFDLMNPELDLFPSFVYTPDDSRNGEYLWRWKKITKSLLSWNRCQWNSGASSIDREIVQKILFYIS